MNNNIKNIFINDMFSYVITMYNIKVHPVSQVFLYSLELPGRLCRFLARFPHVVLSVMLKTNLFCFLSDPKRKTLSERT